MTHDVEANDSAGVRWLVESTKLQFVALAVVLICV